MIKAVCIDDSNRPKEIPENKWVKKGNEYDIIWVYVILNEKQKGVQGVDLAEINLDESNTPYLHFNLNRFAVFNIEDFKKLASECSGFDMEEINKIIKREELIEI